MDDFHTARLKTDVPNQVNIKPFDITVPNGGNVAQTDKGILSTADFASYSYE